MTHSRPLFHVIIQADFTEEQHMNLDSVHGTNRYGQLMEKLSAGNGI